MTNKQLDHETWEQDTLCSSWDVFINNGYKLAAVIWHIHVKIQTACSRESLHLTCWKSQDYVHINILACIMSYPRWSCSRYCDRQQQQCSTFPLPTPQFYEIIKAIKQMHLHFHWFQVFHFMLVILNSLELCTSSILFVYVQQHPLEVLITDSALCSGMQTQQGSADIDKTSQWFINKHKNLQVMQKNL